MLVRVCGLLIVILVVSNLFAEGLRIVEIDSPTGTGSQVPNLAVHENIVYMSWLTESLSGAQSLQWSLWDGTLWSEPRVIHSSPRMFANWADYPSFSVLNEGTYVAHWLEKSGEGTYDYDVWVTQSKDSGHTWSTPQRPYRDRTLGEHGFVSIVDQGEGRFAIFWLDARKFKGQPPQREMSLMCSNFDKGHFRSETMLDGRVCDCCQISAVATPNGMFVAYRDRSLDEIRDISYKRYTEGHWTVSRTLYSDGWEIPACPVNGPAVTARASSLVVAWFSLIGEEGRVRTIWSSDGGKTFGEPVRLDGGKALGRVDIEWFDEGTSLLVSWLERLEDGEAEVRVREVHSNGTLGPPLGVARTHSSRASGFPQLIRQDKTLVIAWTDAKAKRIRLAKIFHEMEVVLD